MPKAVQFDSYGGIDVLEKLLKFTIDESIKLEITNYPLAEASVAHSQLEERKEHRKARVDS